jgi:Zn-dependent peptidase ImmA (M78 family)
LLRRGFKSQCERRSAELRKRLGLGPAEPLSAFDLADHVGATVWSTAQVDGLGKADLAQLTKIDKESWSAFTLRIQDRHLIVFNSGQTEPRINSVVMHELSHIMLGHELASAGMTNDGHLIPSNYDQGQEAEADWLGGTLLLPRPVLLAIRRRGLTDDQAMVEYQVSRQMLTWRFRMTGVDYQLANARKKRFRKS